MVIYRDREWSGLGQPVNNNGTTPRPLLSPGLRIMTAHYPGFALGNSARGKYDTDTTKRTYVLAVQRNAIAQSKSFEYNFFVFMDGEVWEYAGDHLAAHSEGENTVSYGVQFVNGQDDLCTPQQENGYRWLRDVHLTPRGRVVNAQTIPHKGMPGASTACPGERAIIPALDRLRLPYVPPDTTPEGDDDVYRILVLTNAGGAAVLMHGMTARWLDPARYNQYHYFYPYIVDEAADTSWLANLVFLGPLPEGVEKRHVWGHQPDG